MNNPETEFAIPSAIIFLEFTESGPTLIQQSPLGVSKERPNFPNSKFRFPIHVTFYVTLTPL